MRIKFLFVAVMLLFVQLGYALPPWTYTNTGTNHTIIIDTSVHPTFNGAPLNAGDYIGVFYDLNGTLTCGGYEVWTGSGAITVAAFGSDLTLPAKDGFSIGEAFRWEIWRHSDGSIATAQATYKLPGGIITDTGKYEPNGISSLRTLMGTMQFVITSTAGPNGSIAPSGADTVSFGGSPRFIVSPATGYHLDSLLVDGSKVDSTTSYTFVNVSAGHTIRAVFKINSYAITSSAGSNGGISPSGTVLVNYGTNQQFIIMPNTGYHVDSLIVDGSKVDSLFSYTFRNVIASHAIRAVFRINSYAITASAGPNGTITPSGTVNVNYGANQQFTISPATGYHVDSVIVDGAKVDSVTGYTFIGITAAHTIRAVFRINGYTIVASAGAGGLITPSGNVNVSYGSNQQFLITPNTGYHVDTVLVDGAKVDSLLSYTFANVTTNYTIRAVFRINSYTITASAGPNGTITPSGTLQLNYGTNQQFIISPNTGYHVDSLIVDGAKVDSILSYTFKMLSASHTIRAVFKVNSYTISATAGPNGTITPSGSINLTYASSQQFTIAPNTGYHIDSVIVDGSRVDSTTSFTFVNVITAHTIRAVFRINTFIITATAEANGTISPSGGVSVNYGANQQFILTPSTGYHTDSVIVDGSKVDSSVTYTFRNVTAAHAIRVTFKINSYSITSSASLHGSITPLGIVSLNYGGTQSYTVTPDSGCRVDSVVIDGTNRGALLTYVFTHVAGNHTIAVYFSSGPWTFLMPASTGWNMISLPARPPDSRKSVLFPTAKSYAFAYEAGYLIRDSLVCGSGYWLRFDQDQTMSVTGVNLLSDTVAVVHGWNLIGAISYPVMAGTVVSRPPGMITSRFFGYQGKYIITDTLLPGKGYWVKAAQDGQLILSYPGSGSLAAGESERISMSLDDEIPPAPPEPENSAPDLPKDYVLAQSYPNPFNPTTTIEYGLPLQSRISLKIYNLLGQEEATLASGVEEAGYKTVTWNGAGFASGVYFCRLEASSVSVPSMTFAQVRRIILLK